MISEQLIQDLFWGLSKLCNERNEKWNTKELNHGETFMLMVSEIAEAMEGHRKDLMDSHIPTRKQVEVELADLLIRVFHYAGRTGLDLGGALNEKMEYNVWREDHTEKARNAPGGKKY